MSLKPFLLLITGLLVCGTSCVPVQHTLGSLPDEQLRMGSGGGFSGARKEYILLKNGQAFLTEAVGSRQDTLELQAFTRREGRDLFHRLDSLRLHKYDFNYPGNMYYFIRQTDEKVDHTVQWGDPRWEVRPDIERFFRELSESVEKRKVLPKPEEKPKEPTFW